LICAGLSQIVKQRNPKAVTTLLLPDHPRVKNKLAHYYHNFDKVIHLPYCWFSSNIVGGFKRGNVFLQSLRQVQIPDRSILFMFDIFELTELLTYAEYARKRKQGKLKIVSLSAFDTGESQPENVSLLLARSVLSSIYSLRYLGKLFREYRTRNTEAGNIRFFHASWDYQCCVERSYPLRSRPLRVFSSLPYPAAYMKSARSPRSEYLNTLISGNACLILVDSQFPPYASVPRESYWQRVTELIAFLKQNYDMIIYVKNHPGYPGDAEEWIQDSDVKFIDQEISAEEIYIASGSKIRCVFSYGSTALITASWLGIPALNVSEFLGVHDPLLERWNRFLSIGNEIVHIGTLQDLIPAGLHTRSAVGGDSGAAATWMTVLDEIEEGN
jgi:hypothetical protein